MDSELQRILYQLQLTPIEAARKYEALAQQATSSELKKHYENLRSRALKLGGYSHAKGRGKKGTRDAED